MRDVEIYVGFADHTWNTFVVAVEPGKDEDVSTRALARAEEQLQKENVPAAFFGVYWLGE